MVCYFLLDKSDVLTGLIEKSSTGRYSGFPTLMFSGFLKYGLLVMGIGITATLSFFSNKREIKKLE